jgi:hypothetical protein
MVLFKNYLVSNDEILDWNMPRETQAKKKTDSIQIKGYLK